MKPKTANSGSFENKAGHEEMLDEKRASLGQFCNALRANRACDLCRTRDPRFEAAPPELKTAKTLVHSNTFTIGTARLKRWFERLIWS